MSYELTATEKQEIYSATNLLVLCTHGRAGRDRGQACLSWVKCGLEVCKRYCISACLQAGSAAWPMVDAAHDDGMKALHFGYRWLGADDADRRVATIPDGAMPLPEMHCWIGLLGTQEVVDFSTGFIHMAAKAMGYEWEAPRLPPFIWCRADKLPAGITYMPDRDATILAGQLLSGHNVERRMV